MKTATISYFALAAVSVSALPTLQPGGTSTQLEARAPIPYPLNIKTAGEIGAAVGTTQGHEEVKEEQNPQQVPTTYELEGQDKGNI